MIGSLYQITTPPDARKAFCAGIIVAAGIVTGHARIVKYMRDWPLDRVRQYCAKQGWLLCEVLTSSAQEAP